MAARVMKPGKAKRPHGGPSDVSHHQKRPRRDHYSNVDPSATVYSGRRLLGFLVDEPGQCVALTPSRADRHVSESSGSNSHNPDRPNGATPA
jgi:hypothetical protein